MSVALTIHVLACEMYRGCSMEGITTRARERKCAGTCPSLSTALLAHGTSQLMFWGIGLQSQLHDPRPRAMTSTRQCDMHGVWAHYLTVAVGERQLLCLSGGELVQRIRMPTTITTVRAWCPVVACSSREPHFSHHVRKHKCAGVLWPFFVWRAIGGADGWTQ